MMANYLVRGILIGGSLGVFAGLFGIVNMARGAALGMLAGFFAGLTMERRRAKRLEAEKSAPDNAKEQKTKADDRE